MRLAFPFTKSIKIFTKAAWAYKKPFVIFLVLPIVAYLSVFLDFLGYEYEFKQDDSTSEHVYFFPNPDQHSRGLLDFWFLKVIDTPFNLDWYDVCLVNNSYLTNGGEKIEPSTLHGEDGSMSFFILPIRKNIEANENFNYVKEKGLIQNQDNSAEYSIEFSAKKNDEGCIQVSTEEKGFVFYNPNVRLFNMYLPVAIQKSTSVGTVRYISGDNEYSAVSNGSKLVVKTSATAFVFKMFTFTLLFDAFLLLIREIMRMFKDLAMKSKG